VEIDSRVTSASAQRWEMMRVPMAQTAKAGLAWVRDVGLRKFGDRLAGPRW
jgi:hypothetical protein